MKTYIEFLNENVKNSNIIYSPEFKAWFGDWENDPNNSSKVIDKNGKPLIMYHGTYYKHDIDVFNSSIGHDYNFFTNDINEAYRYGDSVKEYYINARNIFDPKNINNIAEIENILNKINIYDLDIDIEMYIWELYKQSVESGEGEKLTTQELLEIKLYVLTETADDWLLLETKEFQDYIKSKGYDSFRTHESDFNVAVYNPCNIKKANDNVTFDKNNPNVNL